ncbi:hypothetical protein UMNF18_2668 [Escherichia coli UMNF18]|nr:hypothetical protein UMNF18_2668 [Escherichia coli UMNF18]EII48642.1 hypothetical protein EC23916_4552 [Escherichia coli 2.3916]
MEIEKLPRQILNSENVYAASCARFPETGKPVFGRRCDHIRHTCSVETEYPIPA